MKIEKRQRRKQKELPDKILAARAIVSC